MSVACAPPKQINAIGCLSAHRNSLKGPEPQGLFLFLLDVAIKVSYTFGMPREKSILNPAILTALTQALETEQKRLQALLVTFAEKDTRVAGDYDTAFPQMGTSLEESADEVEEYENLLPGEFALEKRLEEVTAALARIGEGSYGVCKQCGKEIPLERLQANPESAFCIEHADR